MWAKLMNGGGMAMDRSWYHVPVYYTGLVYGTKELVVLQRTKTKAAIALRNEDKYSAGMVKHVKIMKDNKKNEYFMFKGKRVYFHPYYGHVM